MIAAAARLVWRAAVTAGSVGAAVGTVHTAVNAGLLRRPTADPGPPGRVSVLLPLRNEADRVEPALRSLLDQAHGQDLDLVILDDESTDGTADLVRRVAAGDRRVRLLSGRPVPAGWLGKPHACQQLADAADPASEVLVFVDADVVLAPVAIAATVDLLRRHRLDLVSPFPRQLAVSPMERLVQPLLQWSWLTFLPLRIAERSARTSLAAANGQLLAVRRAPYLRAGGHAGIRTEVLDDVALLRAVKRAGGTGGVADGTGLATCRMYRSWPELRDGYGKSLWTAFGSPAGTVGGLAVLTVLYVVPAIAAAGGSAIGAAGYASGVAGRYLTARRTGGRRWPDPLTHPASVVTFCWLTGYSWRQRRYGTAIWRGRPLPGGGPDGSRPDHPALRSGTPEGLPG